jgi:predicted DNA-binding mobile mystery protein A
MKQPKTHSHNQRRAIDKKLNEIAHLKDLVPPRRGWVKAVRESLGLSTRLLAERLKVSQSVISRLEAREPRKQVTLETLEKVAQSMDCKLVYAIVPSSSSLDQILEAHATKAAERILREVKHSMQLEDQAVSKEESLHQLEELARELKEALDPRLWHKQ